MDSNLIDASAEEEFKLVPDSEPEPESESEPAPVSAPTPKRGRGRPRKTETSGAPVSSVKIETKVTKKKSAAVKTDVAGLANMLLAIHAMAAKMPGMEIVAIAEEEATLLASAMARVGEEYDLSISGKASATIQLVGALAVVYGSRAVMIIDARKKKKPELSVNFDNSGDSQNANSDG